MSSDSEDDKPLVAKAKSKPTISKALDSAMDTSTPSTTNGVKPAISITAAAELGAGTKRKSLSNGKSYKEESSDDEDDIPLSKKRKTAAEKAVPVDKLVQQKAAIEKRAEKEAKSIRQAESKRKSKTADSDDEPLVKKKRANGVKVKKEESDDDVPLSRKTAAVKETPVKKEKIKSEEPEDADEEDDEAQQKWWEAEANGDGSVKWTSLEHNGVIFPPEYEPLPDNVHILYDGKPVKMHKDAEEIAHGFGSMLNSEHNVGNPVFQKNFFHDFKEVLDKTGGARDRNGQKVKITDFKLLDFTKVFEHVDAERQAKKALPSTEKKRIKAERDALEQPYKFCMWSGKKQQVGNFKVEPPGLFRGRGEHPKTGHWKKRVSPEQVTINIGKDAMVPKPPDGHRWKEVKHDQTVTWLATWTENISGASKYVMLNQSSDIKGQSDFKKFEKARALKGLIDRIRADYQRDLKSDVMADRQRATAIYFIDRLALRAGNEKGEDEADTVGCCSLKFEHITLKPPSTVFFRFLGKDSIVFEQDVEVDAQVFKNLKIFKRPPKKDGDEIFDRLTTTTLNKHLSSYMPGLSAKVFRTYNASYTMSVLLKKLKNEGTIVEKVKAYNDANREVAILCNHKRTVTAGHAQQMEKMSDKINALRFQQWRIKQMILDVDPSMKKKKGAAYFDLPAEMDKDWVVEHHKALVEAEKAKIEKKFQKDNEKLVQDKKPRLKDSELKERLEVATELEAKLKKERKTGKVIPEGKGPSAEKYVQQIEKLDERILNAETQSEDRESNKEVALGTSKINYIDPRLTVAFCKARGIPIERFFSKTLRDKFQWAIESAEGDWEF